MRAGVMARTMASRFLAFCGRQVARDDVVDRQRRELAVAERLREREQADRVDLTWSIHDVLVTLDG